jgi:hypothetical protein
MAMIQTRRLAMSTKFSAAQLAALSYPCACAGDATDACKWHTASGTSGLLTCDVDDETMKDFGGPVWHASVCPPVRAYANALLAKVGEGVLFDTLGMRPAIYHLRRRMTIEEIRRLGASDRC